MGLSEEEQKKSQELRLQLNGEINIDQSSRDTMTQTQTNEENTAACRSQVEFIGCCQENGDSCCQTQVLLDQKDKPDAGKKLHSLGSIGKSTSTRKVCAMPTWLESWEREDTYAALAVACAAVSVFVAYSCYKQLG